MFSLLVLSVYGLVFTVISQLFMKISFVWPGNEVSAGFLRSALRGLSTVGEHCTALVGLVEAQASVKKFEGEVECLFKANTVAAISKEFIARIEVELEDGQVEGEVNLLAFQARQEADQDMLPAAIRDCTLLQQFLEAEQQ